MRWGWIRNNPCHSESRWTWCAPFLASFARSGALPVFLSLILSSTAAAQTPQELLNTGRADQAIQTLEQQTRTAPTAEAYNLLCRAHFELGAWDVGIPSCEKAVAL